MRWMMCIGVVAMLAGCDASKEDLESTKSALSTVTSERDQLKIQVTTLQQQLDVSKAELAKAKTASAPPAPATATDAKHAASTAPAKAKPVHKS